MIRHLLRLVWNRKRSNVLIAIEVLLSFVVLTAVVTLGVFYADNYRQPLGFDVDNIWVITIEKRSVKDGAAASAESTASTQAVGDPTDVGHGWVEQRARINRLLMALRGLPEVDAVGAAAIAPYSANSTSEDVEHRGRQYAFGLNFVTDGFARAMGVSVTSGRWFTAEDDGAHWRPVVLNEQLARAMFPDTNPVGAFIGDASETSDRRRVVGIVRAFKKDGEYLAAEHYMFERIRMDDPNREVRPPREMIIRVRPGMTAAFEERAVALLRSAEPDWSFQAESLVQSRETALRLWRAPVTAAGIVAAFLLSMVALGLTGVLWLHITQRTREIGLRRAKGATRVAIQRQFVGEVLILTTIAVAIGVALVIQLPILQVFEAVRPGVYAISVSVSALLIFALTTACAWAPGRMASAVDPVEALRYE